MVFGEFGWPGKIIILYLAFLYIFAVRLMAYNLRKKREEARFDEEEKQ